MNDHPSSPPFARFRTAILFVPLLVAPALAPAQTTLSLFNGTSLLGWNAHGPWSVSNGALTTTATQSRSIMTAVPFADFDLSFDYTERSLMNAKLRIWAPKDDKGGVYIDLDGNGQGVGVGGIEDAQHSQIATISGDVWHHVEVNANHGNVSVKIDGTPTSTLSTNSPRDGYIAFDAGSDGTLQLRSINLRPLNVGAAYNGSDLGSWKAVAENPTAKGGLAHGMEKTLTFGIGGGTTKPHAAKWTVKDGAIHGENGPGGLEYKTPFDDGILQLTASVKGTPKPEHFAAIAVREPQGQLAGGYAIGIGPFTGSIQGQAKHPIGSPGTSVEQTVVIAGRTIAIWINGQLATVNTDPRPEAKLVAQGARNDSGSLTLVLPADNVQIDVQKIAVANFPRSYGVVAPPPKPVVQAATAPTPAVAPPPAPSPAETVLLQQQQTSNQQAETDRENKAKVASLMAQALSTQDPGRQMDLYNQVVQLDPSNAPAVQGYKDAQTKLQTSQAQQQQTIATQVYAQHTTLTRDQQVNDSLVKAQGAFLAGRILEASTALGVAERLAPGNPMVRDLRGRINSVTTLRSRLVYLGSGAGLLALISLIALWFRRRRQQRFPMLEIINGLDAGQQFPLDKDVIRIGAVAQDGGQKNDIVVRDVDQMVSRFHCEIGRQNGQLYLTDLKSSNGTKLEGAPLDAGQPALLRGGDRINLADAVELRLGYARRDKAKA